MPFPTTGPALFDLFAGDVILSGDEEEETPGLLGSYLLPEDEVRPALSVLMPEEVLPEEWSTRGVEVAISRFPTNGPTPLASGEVLLRPLFRIYVSQHRVAPGGAYNLQQVVDRILTLLPGATSADSTLPGGIGGLAQVAIRWTNVEVSSV